MPINDHISLQDLLSLDLPEAADDPGLRPEVIRDISAWAKYELGITLRPFQEEFLKDPAKRKILRVGRQIGKCVAEDTRILTYPCNFVKIKDLPDQGWLYSVNAINELCPAEYIRTYSGKKECFELELTNGHTLISTADHRILTVTTLRGRQYKKLSTVRVGNLVGVVYRYPSYEITRSEYGGGSVLLSEQGVSGDLSKVSPKKLWLSNKQWLSENIRPTASFKEYRLDCDSASAAKEVQAALILLDFYTERQGRFIRFNKYPEIFRLNNYLFPNKNPVNTTTKDRIYITKNKIGNVIWSKVKKITPVGPRETYDLYVNNYFHNFVADGIIVHNSLSMSVMALWKAVIKPRTLVHLISQSSKEIDELMTKKILPFTKRSERLASCITRSTFTPGHQLIQFDNGSIIQGFVISDNKTANSYRGQSPLLDDNPSMLYILDEFDYLPSELIRDIIWPIILRHDFIEVIAASTPAPHRQMFYDMCKNPERYGFKHFHYSTPDVDPDWNDERERLARSFAGTQAKYTLEYLAEFSEDFDCVYPHALLEMAFEGPFSKYNYSTDIDIESPMRIGGVDWNKYPNGPEIIILEYNKELRRFVITYREVIEGAQSKDYGKNVILSSVRRVIELNDLMQITYWYVDVGFGDVPLELFQEQGLKNVKPVHSNTNKQLSNPYYDPEKHDKSEEFIKIRMKQWMITCLQWMLENNLLIGCIDGVKDGGNFSYGIAEELQAFTVDNVTLLGYTYKTTIEDHAHDALALAALGCKELFFDAAKPDLFIPISLGFVDPIKELREGERRANDEDRDFIVGVPGSNSKINVGRSYTNIYARKYY